MLPDHRWILKVALFIFFQCKFIMKCFSCHYAHKGKCPSAEKRQKMQSFISMKGIVGFLVDQLLTDVVSPIYDWYWHVLIITVSLLIIIYNITVLSFLWIRVLRNICYVFSLFGNLYFLLWFSHVSFPADILRVRAQFSRALTFVRIRKDSTLCLCLTGREA